MSGSHDHCDITAGNDYVRNEWPTFELHFPHNDAVWMLHRLGPAASHEGVHEMCHYKARVKVTGTLTLATKKIDATMALTNELIFLNNSGDSPVSCLDRSMAPVTSLESPQALWTDSSS